MKRSSAIRKERIGVGGLRLTPLAKKYVNEALDTNRLSYGPYSRRFEQAFAKAHNVAFSCFMNSGTDALRISLSAMKERFGWHDGDEVIVPAVTFVATSNIVIQNQMKPVFVDVHPRTYNIDTEKIAEKISARTKAIIPVHLMGLPCDMDPILSLSKKYGLKIIEDSCEAMFATYKGRKVGSIGDAGAFSTYVAHYLVTGVGGLATTNDPELANDIRSFMNHGRDTAYVTIDDDKDISLDKLRDVVNKRFSFIHVGYSSRCTELEAAMGLAQLEEGEDIIKGRKKAVSRYQAGLKDLEDRLQLPVDPEGPSNAYMLYPLMLRHEEKYGLVQFLEQNRIETRDLMPLISQPVYRKLFGDLEAAYPVAEKINRCGFYIGCHQCLSEEEQAYVIQKIHEFFEK